MYVCMYASKEAEPIVTERHACKDWTYQVCNKEDSEDGRDDVPMVVALTTVEHRLSQTQAIGGMKLTKQEAWGCGLCVNLSLSQ